MHADIINSRDEGLRRILATRVEVDCVADLDPLVDHLARDANPLCRSWHRKSRVRCTSPQWSWV